LAINITPVPDRDVEAGDVGTASAETATVDRIDYVLGVASLTFLGVLLSVAATFGFGVGVPIAGRWGVVWGLVVGLAVGVGIGAALVLVLHWNLLSGVRRRIDEFARRIVA
jgi:hypothetical protein